MTPPEDSSPAPTARLALLGAASLLGKEVKDQLAASGFPSDALALFDVEELAGVLTDYGDEARVFAESITERVLAHDLVCFCGDRDAAADYLDPLLDGGRLGLDCTGAWIDDERAYPWVPGASTPPQLQNDRAVAIPGGAALVLARLLSAIDGHGTQVSAQLFVPATERGDAGLEELSSQSTAVLNLLDFSEQVFGRQQAFDLWLPPEDSPLCGRNLSRVMARLSLPAAAINVVSAPVFHGITLSAFVADASAADLDAALREADLGEPQEEGDELADSPVRAVGRAGLLGLQLRDDGGGTWIWAVADNLHARAAAAVAAIHTLLPPQVTDQTQ
jgi:aspartate-semialdehyde dehydrogenase